MNRHELMVMGDVNLDWVVQGNLDVAFAELVENGVIRWQAIEEMPGGSGLNFARFAVEQGFAATLLGSIGSDLAGDFLLERLTASGIRPALVRHPDLPTGRAMIVRDRRDIRFLVNNDPNANAALDAVQVEAHRAALQGCRLLYVSGYCVMDPEAPRYGATLEAMALAAGGEGPSPRVVFDVVPHRIYDLYSFEEFRRLTARVDLLISEVATLRRFLGLGERSEEIDRAMAEETLERLDGVYPALILRYGPSGCDYQLCWDGRHLDWQETGHAQAADKRGFGDVLALAALRDFFGVEAASGRG